MAKLKSELNATFQEGKNLPGNYWSSLKEGFQDLTKAGAVKEPGFIGKTFGKIGSGIGAVWGASAKAGLWVVEQPFAYLTKTAKVGVRFVGRHGFATTVVVAAAGTYYLSNRLRSNAAENTQENAAAQIASVNANATANYQVTPEEYAAMQAKMRGSNGAPVTGHADAIAAARQQQTGAMTPSV